MTRRDDYVDEMPGMPISDTDVESLLTRREPSDPELLGLASALARVDTRRLAFDVEKRVGVFSLRAAALARQSAAKSTKTVPWWRRVGPKLVTSALSVVVVIGMAGVAVASDHAAPGDFLYGIDRALERLGINDGGTAERLEEASTVAGQGRAADALNHAAEAVSSSSPEAANALSQAAQSVTGGEGTTDAVAEMLTWMSATDLSGRDFGQGVAERARQLGGGQSSQPEDIGPPDDPGASQPSTPADQPGPAGPGEPGNPANTDDHGNQGTTDSPGPPDETGDPGNSGNAGGNGNQGGNSGNQGGNGPPGGEPPGQSGG